MDEQQGKGEWKFAQVFSQRPNFAMHKFQATQRSNMKEMKRKKATTDTEVEDL